MFKFFRKYNTWLVVIGGAFLMVAFLVPQAIQQLGANPSNTPYATFNLGEPVRVNVEAHDEASREFAILNAIRFNHQNVFGQPLAGSLAFQLGITDVDQWLVLSTEAEQARLVGGLGEGDRLFERIATALVETLVEQRRLFARSGPQGQITPMMPDEANELLNSLLADMQSTRDGAISNRATPEFIDRTLAKAAGVGRLALLYTRPMPPSITESWSAAREVGDSASITSAFLSAQVRADDLAEPTPGQLESHFDEYAAADPADTPLGVGYILEPAVMFEAFIIRARPVQDAVVLDDVEINAYWRRNRDRFGQDFSTSRRAVEMQLRTERGAELIRRVEEVVRRSLYASQLRLESAEDGSKILPADWADQRLDLDQLAQDTRSTLAEEMSVEPQAIESAFAVIRRDASFRTRSQITTDPVVGRATLPGAVAQQQVTIADALLSARELGGDPSSSRTQAGLLVERPFALPEGGLVYPRILAVRPRGAPESLDVIRDDVTEGVRLVEAFTRLEEDAGTFTARVAESGDLGVLIDESGVELQGELTVSSRGTRTSAQPRQLEFDTEAFREAILTRARELSALAETGGVSIADLPHADRVLSVPVPEARGLIVARIDDFTPISPDDYASPFLISQVERTLRATSSIRVSPLSWPRVQDRTEFTLIRIGGGGDQDLEQVEAEAPDDAAPAAGE
ncbi:MAG: hypothetical protein AAGI30_06465 [Planctomycetota bacterium]